MKQWFAWIDILGKVEVGGLQKSFMIPHDAIIEKVSNGYIVAPLSTSTNIVSLGPNRQSKHFVCTLSNGKNIYTAGMVYFFGGLSDDSNIFNLKNKSNKKNIINESDCILCVEGLRALMNKEKFKMVDLNQYYDDRTDSFKIKGNLPYLPDKYKFTEYNPNE